MVGIVLNRVITFDNVKSYSAATKLVTASLDKQALNANKFVTPHWTIEHSNYEITQASRISSDSK